ncbi:hypothetical protein I3760_07G229000 [Carya illinoinensis]|uniref:ABC1 atypical kinase-like domain-containing protein n=1 Tax=Carya illinoinensis TaxID=32201 RepID=A0A922ERI2_CARIL|nr:uncharacterized protein slr1919 isoform X2 [Carya illinoinensis]KAG2700406.1 hypothetical protein I3760_07G229000 [Carya illinoinensis]KAG2700407.1 hypothetical protein I3760_07G229000 [Carya illinoinensis]KAG6706719.1 hypothetical protein I3842_07G235100 [Carya illinoinensis]KAG6706725.1 hypothetical protein I3842_07G235100 [Carya illinoinensis]
MRNVFASLNRRGHISVLSRSLRHDCTVDAILQKCTSLACQTDLEIVRRKYNWNPLCLLHRNSFSTGFTSVHGESPSAEYAKLRKESLESEFGHALGTYGKSISIVPRFGPLLALYRGAIISSYVIKLSIWQFFVQDIRKRAVKFRETLIHLGPFYIKLGQALSTRPDILPAVYCQELAKLQLGVPVSQVFADISPEPIAAASLGQVYKAHLHSGELVAVKVQRPGMSLSLTLDALLFHMIGGQLKRFATAQKDLLVSVNEVVRHMFDEIDYVLEGRNAERFASLYGYSPCSDNSRQKKPATGKTVTYEKANWVKVPKIYWDLTRTAVLTMEWVDGIKLTDEIGLKKACLNRRKLIDQGLYCSLRQLLEVGFFHADPHPGNLVATDTGSLAYFDFGMMGDIPRHYRVGLIQMLVHFVNRDSLGLANDFLSLGFIPEGVEILSVSDALQASFGTGTRQSQDFQGLMNQLYDVMYEFNFSLPPDYALVIRALGSLEGTAKVLDPDFKVIESAYPFVIGRLLEDPDPDMRKILRELLIRNNGSMRWNRLERLMAAISEQPSKSSGEPTNSEDNYSSPLGWKSFDMRAVVAATEDLLLFILSEKGLRVRVFLLRDIIGAADVFMQDKVVDCIPSENVEARETLEFEEHAMLTRIVDGFRYFCEAIKSAPAVWTAMLLRMAAKPEVHKFIFDMISALVTHFSFKLTETSWVCISRFLHMLVKKCSSDELRHQ